MRFPGTALLCIEGLPAGLLIEPVRNALAQAFEDVAELRAILSLHRDAHLSALPANDAGRWNICLKTPTASNAAAGQLQTGFRVLANSLRDTGVVPGWRDECFSVRKPDGSAWFALERACFRPLGLISTAVHAHAWCTNGDTWLGRRAAHKATDPGKLDNLAAGGLTHGEMPQACMVRELWEEAGVPEHLACHIQALPQLLLSERVEREGIHREWLHCYTLDLPDDFMPQNRDGEVNGFTRLTPAELQAVMDSGDMTVDAALCANLALRLRRAV